MLCLSIYCGRLQAAMFHWADYKFSSITMKGCIFDVGAMPWTFIGSQIYSRSQVELIFLWKWSIPCNTPRKYLTPFFMLYVYKCQIRTKMLSYLCWSYTILTLKSWQSFKSFTQSCGLRNVFHSAASFSTDIMLLAYCYSVTISMTSILEFYLLRTLKLEHIICCIFQL